MSLSGVYRYFLVLLVSACVARYVLKLSQQKPLVATLDKGWEAVAKFGRHQGINLPLINLEQTIGLAESQKWEKLAWYGLMVLPAVAVVGVRKHLLIYFLLFIGLLLLDLPQHWGKMDKFFEAQIENILMIGLAGYSSSI